MRLTFVRDLPHGDYLLVVALGVLCGLLGALHNRGMFSCQNLYNRINKCTPYLRLIVPFMLAGVVAFVWPDLMCGGDAIFERIVEPRGIALTSVIALLLGKYLFTTISFGSGAPGGTLFPLVVMGALIGSGFALIANLVLGFDLAFYPNFIALGIAGLFASVVRAPVCGVVLVFELTGSLDAMLSVSLFSSLYYMVANLTKTDPFYEHLLSKQLDVAIDNPVITGLAGQKVVKKVHVGSGSRLEGMLIREVPWPDGSRVILVERASAELIPDGSTKLEALDELLMIMDAGAEADAMLKLELMTRPSVVR